ncbi:MAG: nucleotide sugar dehydrogenase, partial [Nanoarchaeota archaeon]
GDKLLQGSIVVYESTVYPGVTEEVCVPILEKASKLKCGVDFKVGYSPERINPGDREHTIHTVTKIVSGMDEEALNMVDYVYGKITTTHRASSIKVAEAAKVIENIQRDLNIALMNELAVIFDKMGIDVHDVLEAAGTKWNFHKYHPGLVGGHCIGVDPYYLTYTAQGYGYHPEVILAGRRINDAMHSFYAQKIIRMMRKSGGETVLIAGLTFKPNVPDYRNSRVKHLIKELQEYNLTVYGYDPLLEKEIVEKEFGIKYVDPSVKADLVVIAVEHRQLQKMHEGGVFGNTKVIKLKELHGK